MPATASVIVSFSSNERIFLDALLSEAVKFAQQVVVTYGTCFYDGTPEDIEWIEGKAREWARRAESGGGGRVKFVSYDVTREVANNPLKTRPHAYWHNISRIRGVAELGELGAVTDLAELDEQKAKPDFVFFVDGDEIAEGDLVREWLAKVDIPRERAYMLANYWYFRNPRYQAMSLESSILMVPYAWVDSDAKAHAVLMKDWERHGVENVVSGVLAAPNRPMFHHFSWVRSKADLLRKVATWGHKDDKDWAGLIEHEFAGEFEGRDFVHGYEFKIVPNRWAILV